jgi:hypothetical protein
MCIPLPRICKSELSATYPPGDVSFTADVALHIFWTTMRLNYMALTRKRVKGAIEELKSSVLELLGPILRK